MKTTPDDRSAAPGSGLPLLEASMGLQPVEPPGLSPHTSPPQGAAAAPAFKAPPDRPSPAAALAALLFSTIGPYFSAFIGMWLASMIRFTRANQGLFWIGIDLFFFLTPISLYFLLRPRLFPTLRFKRLDVRCGALIVLGAAVIMPAIAYLSLCWQVFLATFGLIPQPQDALFSALESQPLLLLILTAVSTPLCEELLFRGFLFSALEPRGKRFAAFHVSLLFVLVHLNIEALPAHILISALLALLLITTDSLLAPMLCHAAYNGFIVAASYLPTADAAASSSPVTGQELLTFAPFILALLVVGALLLRAAIRRGVPSLAQKLADAAPRGRSVGARLLLAGTILLFASLELFLLLDMIPG